MPARRPRLRRRLARIEARLDALEHATPVNYTMPPAPATDVNLDPRLPLAAELAPAAPTVALPDDDDDARPTGLYL